MDKTTKQLATWGGAGLLIISGGLFGVAKLNERPGALDGFASCLAQEGAVFYGAFWCPNCAAQKQMFGRSERILPYIECATSDGKGQVSLCEEKGITGYPTWEFKSGERMTGVTPLQTLAEKTGCILP